MNNNKVYIISRWNGLDTVFYSGTRKNPDTGNYFNSYSTRMSNAIIFSEDEFEAAKNLAKVDRAVVLEYQP